MARHRSFDVHLRSFNRHSANAPYAADRIRRVAGGRFAVSRGAVPRSRIHEFCAMPASSSRVRTGVLAPRSPRARYLPGMATQKKPTIARAVIDHTGIGVADVARSAAFYDATLGALGLRRVAELPAGSGADGVAYGVNHPAFWIDRFHPHGVRQHTAFVALDRAQVDAFHAAAIRAGGTDNGAPGFRDTATGYPPGYYAAFVLDPDGNNVEALFRAR
jgi:catechol 2,3-dioxygenase-like lactoylglutathione lyase family enzyme